MNKSLKILLYIIAIIFIFFIGVAIWFNGIYDKMDRAKLTTEVTFQTIPFRWSPSKHILVDVKINNSEKSYPFMLDSGASTFVFGNLLAEQYNDL